MMQSQNCLNMTGMCGWLGEAITSLLESQEENNSSSVMARHAFLPESLSNEVAVKTLEYSLKTNNISLLNFDSLPC